MKPTPSLKTGLRISNNVLSQTLQRELVMLDLNNGVYYGLDPVGARTWELIREHQDLPLQTVFDVLLDEYNVTRERCAQDLLYLVGQLQEKGLVVATNADHS